MLSPNSTANIMSGTKLAIGTVEAVVSMPTKSMPQPHWKTTVRMPKAARAVRKFVIAAWMGMSSERNATSSTSMLSSRIVAMTRGSRSEISAARSTLEAVEPPTNAVKPFSEFAGITVERRWRTRSAVAGAEGAVLAITVNVAALPFEEIEGGATSVSALTPIRPSWSFTSRGSVPRSSPPAFVIVLTS